MPQRFLNALKIVSEKDDGFSETIQKYLRFCSKTSIVSENTADFSETMICLTNKAW